MMLESKDGGSHTRLLKYFAQRIDTQQNEDNQVYCYAIDVC